MKCVCVCVCDDKRGNEKERAEPTRVRNQAKANKIAKIINLPSQYQSPIIVMLMMGFLFERKWPILWSGGATIGITGKWSQVRIFSRSIKQRTETQQLFYRSWISIELSLLWRWWWWAHVVQDKTTMLQRLHAVCYERTKSNVGGKGSWWTEKNRKRRKRSECVVWEWTKRNRTEWTAHITFTWMTWQWWIWKEKK